MVDILLILFRCPQKFYSPNQPKAVFLIQRKDIFPLFMETEDIDKINLTQFKGHHRKFPWGLVIRIILVAVGFIVVTILLNQLSEKYDQPIKNIEKDVELEVQ